MKGQNKLFHFIVVAFHKYKLKFVGLTMLIKFISC